MAELSGLARRAGGNEPRCVAINLPGHGSACSEAPALPLSSWTPFSDAVLAAARSADGPRVGVGHSLGATALVLAELANPGTFEALLLFEPIIFPPWVPSGRHEKNPLAAGAARRKASFEDAEAARAYLLSKPMFAAFDRAALDGYVRGGLRPGADGTLELCCDRDFEADIYRSDLSGIWGRLPSLASPTVKIWCGSASRHLDAVGPGGSTVELYRQLAANVGAGGATFEAMEGVGHFGPLESPARFASSLLWPALRTSSAGARSKL